MGATGLYARVGPVGQGVQALPVGLVHLHRPRQRLGHEALQLVGVPLGQRGMTGVPRRTVGGGQIPHGHLSLRVGHAAVGVQGQLRVGLGVLGALQHQGLHVTHPVSGLDRGHHELTDLVDQPSVLLGQPPRHLPGLGHRQPPGQHRPLRRLSVLTGSQQGRTQTTQG